MARTERPRAGRWCRYNDEHEHVAAASGFGNGRFGGGCGGFSGIRGTDKGAWSPSEHTYSRDCTGRLPPGRCQVERQHG